MRALGKVALVENPIIPERRPLQPITDPRTPLPLPERRFMLRYPSRGAAVVLRDNDVMRLGIEGKLRDISSNGVGLLMPEPLTVGESIKVVLRNEIQKIERKVRGVVRHVTQQPDGRYLIGLELYCRLTPLDVSLLRMSTF